MAIQRDCRYIKRYCQNYQHFQLHRDLQAAGTIYQSVFASSNQYFYVSGHYLDPHFQDDRNKECDMEVQI